MKRLILLAGVFCALSTQAQFPGTDSLHRYNNRFIRNSAVEAFSNLRLNTLLHGIIQWIDSAEAGVSGGGIDTLYAINDSTLRYKKNGQNRDVTIKGVGGTGNIIPGLNLSKSGDSLRLNDSIVLMNFRVSTASGENHYIDVSEKGENDYLTKLNVQNMLAEIQSPALVLLIDSTLKWDSTGQTPVLGVNRTWTYSKFQTDSLHAIRDPRAIDTVNRVADSIRYVRVNGQSWKVKDSTGTGGYPGYTIDATPMGNSPNQLPTSEAVRAAMDALVIGSATGDVLRTSIAGLDASTTFLTSKVYWLTDSLKNGPVVWTGKMATGQAGDDGVINFITADSNRYSRVYDGKIDLRWAGLRPGTDGTTRTNNVLAWAKVKAVALDAQTIYEPPGDWYYNDSIGLFTAIQGKTYHVLSGGNSFFSSANGFVLGDKGPVNFDHSIGNIYGPNAYVLTADSLTWEAFVGGDDGVGLDMINVYNSNVKFNEIMQFRTGFRMLGRFIVDPADGTQMNRIDGNWVHHNRTNVAITTQGDGGSLSPWANESIININQIGRGFGSTNIGGWYGLVVGRTPGSNSPDRNISGNVINAKIEGNRFGLYMNYAASNTFTIGVEDGANTYDFRINDTTCLNNVFLGADYFNDNMFVPGWGGKNTTVVGKPFWSAVGSNQGYMSMWATWIVSPGTVSHWQSRMDQFPGFTVWSRNTTEYILDRAANIFNSAPLTDVYGRMTKFGGQTRYVGYAPQPALINDAFEDGDTLGVITGNILATNSTNKTVKLDVRDLTLGFLYYPIRIEKSGSGDFRLVRSDNGASIFTILGSAGSVKYSLSYRFGAWSSTVDGGGGGGSGITNMYYEMDALHSYPSGVAIAGNTAGLGAADGTYPGGVVPFDQYWKGRKAFDSLRTPRLDFRDEAGTLSQYPVFRVANGLVFNDGSIPNPTNTTQFTWNIGSGSSTKNPIFGFGKTGVNWVGMANNGVNMVFMAEKNTGGFDFRNASGFASMTPSTGTLLAQILPNGGFRATGLAGVGTRTLGVLADGTFTTVSGGGSGGSAYPFTKTPDSSGANSTVPIRIGSYVNPGAYFDLTGSSLTKPAMRMIGGLTNVAIPFALEMSSLGEFHVTKASGERKKAMMQPNGGSAGQIVKMNVAETDLEFGTASASMGNYHGVSNANLTVVAGDYSCIIYGMSADRTMTLPNPATSANRVLVIGQNNGNGYYINLSYSIYSGGATSPVGTILNDNKFMIQSDGTRWQIIMSKL